MREEGGGDGTALIRPLANKHPTPFEWTKPAAAIIRSHKRMLARISRPVH
jgi:hypothetical protein